MVIPKLIMNNSRKCKRRIPVIYGKTQLMPMRWGRVRKYLNLGKGVLKYHNKLGVLYLKLLVEPSGFEIQKITLGIDPGTHFDGFTICSEYCHHDNIMLIHNKGKRSEKTGKYSNTIKDKMNGRKEGRKRRRSRLRQREARFDNRTSNKIVPSIQSMLDFRKWNIEKVLELYPISNVVYEDVAYNHWKDRGDNPRIGRSFSQVEVGKKRFFEYLISKFGSFKKVRGYITKNRRMKLFYGKDLKSGNKAEKSFWSHGIDSFTLCNLNNDFDIKYLNTKVRCLEKIQFVRRELHKWKNKIGDKRYYFKYLKGGIKEYFKEYCGKKNICRVQKYENNFKEFRYVDNGRTLKFKKFRTNYGGTVWSGISKYAKYKYLENNEIVGVKKFGRSHIMCKWISKNLDKVRLMEYKHQNLETYL